MKLILLVVLLLVSSFSLAASTTPVPQNAGLTNVYVTDQYGNGIFDQTSLNAVSVSLGSTVGKTIVGQGSTLATSSTAYSEPLAYTTTAGKTFYITGYSIEGSLSVISGTAVGLGYCSLQVPRGTTLSTFRFVNSTTGGMDRAIMTPAEPIAAGPGQAVVVSCRPQSSTSTIWGANVIGYEK